jgi:hypothetical protein
MPLTHVRFRWCESRRAGLSAEAATAAVSACSFEAAETDYERAVELEPWEREHGRQLQQVKKEIALRRSSKEPTAAATANLGTAVGSI